MSRALALAPALMLAALVAVFGFYALHHDPQVIPRATVGKPAPDDSLPTLGGGAPAPIRSAVPGPMLVNFFASWCAPCAAEAPTLKALSDEGVRVVGVAWKDDPVQSREFLQRYGDPYKVVFVDRAGTTGIDFGVTGVPETYLVGGDGRILDKTAGPLTAADAQALARRAGF